MKTTLCIGALLVLGLTAASSAFAERGRGGGGESRRVESPGVGAPGAGSRNHYDGVEVNHTGPGVSAANNMEAGAAAARPAAGAGAPGVGARPGVGAGAPGAGVAPGVGVGSPGAGVLPRGYVSTVPTGWSRVYYNGYYCAYAGGIYYRPIYYQGVVVYMEIPSTPPATSTSTNS